MTAITATTTAVHTPFEDAGFGEAQLAASTIDRRLSTVCGFDRFAHIDGRIGSNPAECVRRPQVHPSDARGLDRCELGMFLAAADRYDSAHQALAVLLGLNGLRVSEACATNVEDLAVERGHRILRITGKGNRPATIPLVPRTDRTIDLAVGERHEARCPGRDVDARMIVATSAGASDIGTCPPLRMATRTVCAGSSSVNRAWRRSRIRSRVPKASVTGASISPSRTNLSRCVAASVDRKPAPLAIAATWPRAASGVSRSGWPKTCQKISRRAHPHRDNAPMTPPPWRHARQVASRLARA